MVVELELKLEKNIVPSTIIDAGGDVDSAKTHVGKPNLTDFTLKDWVKSMQIP